MNKSLVGWTTRINELHAKVEGSARRTLKDAAHCGRLLAKVRDTLAHGGWGRWLADNFNGSDRTARVYCQLAEGLGKLAGKSAVVAEMGIGEALRMLAEPKRASGGGGDGPLKVLTPSETQAFIDRANERTPGSIDPEWAAELLGIAAEDLQVGWMYRDFVGDGEAAAVGFDVLVANPPAGVAERLEAAGLDRSWLWRCACAWERSQHEAMAA